jgi:asparagine N-glycosylation enzyme membrane subunit Stt3
MTNKSLFKTSLWLVAIIFILNSLAMKFYWYFTIWWFDMPMHFLGGVFIGFVSIAAYVKYFAKEKPSAARIAWTVFFSVLIIGVLWEIFESGVNFLTVSQQNPILDTWSDIAYDIAGGLFAAFYYLRKAY